MTKQSPICFIIQPFDKGEFDELYDDVIEIAVKESGAICLRSDKILGAKPPLEKIKESIENTSVCIAEVTLDNPNVFFEAGWAFALKKPIFILWDKAKRTKGLPFDIHGKAGIPYNSVQNSWRKSLRIQLTENILYELSHTVQSKKQTPYVNPEYNEIELTLLAILIKAEGKNQEIGILTLNQLLASLGYEETKTILAANKLLEAKVIDRTYNTQGDSFCFYYLTPNGKEFIEKLYDKIEPIFKTLPKNLGVSNSRLRVRRWL